MKQRFDSETRRSRVRNTRLAVTVGVPAYLVFCMFDAAMLSGMGHWLVFFRIATILPAGTFIIWKAPTLGADVREGFLAIAVTLAMAGPVAFIGLSSIPQMTYMMLVVVLVGMYANVTLRLRFRWACFFNAATIVAVGAVILGGDDLPGDLVGLLAASTMVSTVLGLTANFQLERAERSAFLAGLKESIRLDGLEDERRLLSNLSLMDPLTGLPNRRAFEAKMISLCDHHRVDGRDFALLMVDIDFFKSFNDHYGHVEGDACICAVAQLFRECIGDEGDMVARLGGEEFAFLLSDDATKAVTACEQLRRRLAEAAILHLGRLDGRRSVTVSVGIAFSTDCVPTLIDMMTVADRRLYSAKRSGRDRFCYDDALSKRIA